ncbi:MAG: hypothetical protein WKG07_07165 [Hymenobacter sp.]
MLLEKKVDYNIRRRRHDRRLPDSVTGLRCPTSPSRPSKLLVYAIGLAGGLVPGPGLNWRCATCCTTPLLTCASWSATRKASVLGVIPTYDKEQMDVSRLVVDKNPKSAISGGHPLHPHQPGLHQLGQVRSG